MATAYGPNGMNKMVINHLEKLFVTNDAATIIRELEVEHPAAKMMILGSQMMEQEVVPMDKDLGLFILTKLPRSCS